MGCECSTQEIICTKCSSEIHQGSIHVGDRVRWEHNITMDLRETGYKAADWIHVAQDRDQG
jgi:hypothetical protein